MAPSLRRRGQPSSAEFSQTVSDDSEEFGEEEELDDEQEDQLPDEDDGMDDDEEEEGEEDDEEAQGKSMFFSESSHFPFSLLCGEIFVYTNDAKTQFYIESVCPIRTFFLFAS